MQQNWPYYKSCASTSNGPTNEVNNAQMCDITNMIHDDRDNARDNDHDNDHDNHDNLIDDVIDDDMGDEDRDDDDVCEVANDDVMITGIYTVGDPKPIAGDGQQRHQRKQRSPLSLTSMMMPPPSAPSAPQQTPQSRKRRAAECEGHVAAGDGGTYGNRRPATVQRFVNAARQRDEQGDESNRARRSADDWPSSRSRDENFQFLMSLLPYLRDVPRRRKLLVRHKLQKVLIDEQDFVNRAVVRTAAAAAVATVATAGTDNPGGPVTAQHRPIAANNSSPVSVHQKPIATARHPPPYPYTTAPANSCNFTGVQPSQTPASSSSSVAGVSYVAPSVAVTRTNLTRQNTVQSTANTMNYAAAVAAATGNATGNATGASVQRMDQMRALNNAWAF